MIRFFSFLLVLTLIFFAAIYTGIFTLPSFGKEIIIYMALTTGGVYYLLQKKAGGNLFTQTYLLSIVLKMLAGCAFILIIILADRQGAPANAVLFIVAYLAYTAAEVVFLYHTVSNGRT